MLAPEKPLEAPISEPAGEASWWRRPAGGREVLAVALPLVVSSLSWTVMTFVDRMLLNGVSGDAMAAAFTAGNVWFCAVCFPLGICSYASTFVSQYHGAGKPGRIGPITWQAVWVALAFSPLLLAGIPIAPDFFTLGDHGQVVTDLEVRYFQVLCWGAPAILIGQALSSFYSGRGETRVVMIVDALYAAVNLVLDWLWIFGFTIPGTSIECPPMGVEGAAWATVVSLWLKAVTYGWLMTRPVHREQYATVSGITFEPKLIRRLVQYGGPNGLQVVLDVSAFTFFIMLLGQLGSVASEATTMAFSISTLAFMPVYGLSMATSILVGQHLGEDRDDLAARATWTTFAVALAYMAGVSSLYVFAPDLFLAGFFLGEDGAIDRSGPVYALAVVLLRFVAAYNLLDAALMIFAGAIKGAGDTRFVLQVSVVMAGAFATASWMIVEVWKLGIYGCWAAITLWVWIIGVIFCLRFLQGRWRTMRVIEVGADA